MPRNHRFASRYRSRLRDGTGLRPCRETTASRLAIARACATAPACGLAEKPPLRDSLTLALATAAAFGLAGQPHAPRLAIARAHDGSGLRPGRTTTRSATRYRSHSRRQRPSAWPDNHTLRDSLSLALATAAAFGLAGQPHASRLAIARAPRRRRPAALPRNHALRASLSLALATAAAFGLAGQPHASRLANARARAGAGLRPCRENTASRLANARAPRRRRPAALPRKHRFASRYRSRSAPAPACGLAEKTPLRVSLTLALRAGAGLRPCRETTASRLANARAPRRRRPTALPRNHHFATRQRSHSAPAPACGLAEKPRAPRLAIARAPRLAIARAPRRRRPAALPRNHALRASLSLALRAGAGLRPCRETTRSAPRYRSRSRRRRPAALPRNHALRASLSLALAPAPACGLAEKPRAPRLAIARARAGAGLRPCRETTASRN